MRWICLAVFLVAAGTDWLDGYLARKLNQVTDLGKFLDPLVDKFLVLAPLVGLNSVGSGTGLGSLSDFGAGIADCGLAD
jgi:CDP-diacylglycerol--glycerol-3-phosphate 3-phosphatidyltransferase